jgi:hypothetical protein
MKRFALVAAAILLTVAMLFGGYLAAYELRCTDEVNVQLHEIGPTRIRSYPTRVEATIFIPAAKLDGAWSGDSVFTFPPK